MVVIVKVFSDSKQIAHVFFAMSIFTEKIKPFNPLVQIDVCLVDFNFTGFLKRWSFPQRYILLKRAPSSPFWLFVGIPPEAAGCQLIASCGHRDYYMAQ